MLIVLYLAPQFHSDIPLLKKVTPYFIHPILQVHVLIQTKFPSNSFIDLLYPHKLKTYTMPCNINLLFYSTDLVLWLPIFHCDIPLNNGIMHFLIDPVFQTFSFSPFDFLQQNLKTVLNLLFILK